MKSPQDMTDEELFAASRVTPRDQRRDNLNCAAVFMAAIVACACGGYGLYGAQADYITVLWLALPLLGVGVMAGA